MKEVFKNPPMVSYSRCKSLRDMLVSAKLPPPTTNNNNTRSCRAGFSRCRRGGDLCMMCVTSPARASSHTSTNTGETWPITSQVTCTTKNCVYRITCEKQCGECKKILPYIGITKNRACDRIQQHRGSIFNPGQQGSTKAVAQHFQSSGHTFAHFKTIVIEKVRSKSEFVLRSRERFWIRQYDAIRHGLNIQA